MKPTPLRCTLSSVSPLTLWSTGNPINMNASILLGRTEASRKRALMGYNRLDHLDNAVRVGKARHHSGPGCCRKMIGKRIAPKHDSN
jgi:hypothetical protein